jgi:GYF domain 2
MIPNNKILGKFLLCFLALLAVHVLREVFEFSVGLKNVLVFLTIGLFYGINIFSWNPFDSKKTIVDNPPEGHPAAGKSTQPEATKKAEEKPVTPSEIRPAAPQTVELGSNTFQQVSKSEFISVMQISKKYYIGSDGQTLGPFMLEEMASKRLFPDTLVWTAGLKSWTTAELCEELAPFVEHLPPPLPFGRVVVDEPKDEPLSLPIGNIEESEPLNSVKGESLESQSATQSTANFLQLTKHYKEWKLAGSILAAACFCLGLWLVSIHVDLTAAQDKIVEIADGKPFLVHEITFANFDTSGSSMVYQNHFKFHEVKFIAPKLRISSLVDGANIDIYVKIFSPSGVLKRNDDTSPAGYSYSRHKPYAFLFNDTKTIELSGWGNSAGRSYQVGTHKVEVWAYERGSSFHP